MVKLSALIAAALALSASGALAQTIKSSARMSEGNTPKVTEQAAVSASQRASSNFIIDEYGDVYDSRGDLIRPRPATKK